MLMEYLIQRKHSLKILLKSKHFPGRYGRKREWVFFLKHSVYYRFAYMYCIVEHFTVLLVVSCVDSSN